MYHMLTHISTEKPCFDICQNTPDMCMWTPDMCPHIRSNLTHIGLFFEHKETCMCQIRPDETDNMIGR